MCFVPEDVIKLCTDWKVPGGEVTGPESYYAFTEILGNATELDTGFIVLNTATYRR